MNRRYRRRPLLMKNVKLGMTIDTSMGPGKVVGSYPRTGELPAVRLEITGSALDWVVSFVGRDGKVDFLYGGRTSTVYRLAPRKEAKP